MQNKGLQDRRTQVMAIFAVCSGYALRIHALFFVWFFSVINADCGQAIRRLREPSPSSNPGKQLILRTSTCDFSRTLITLETY